MFWPLKAENLKTKLIFPSYSMISAVNKPKAPRISRCPDNYLRLFSHPGLYMESTFIPRIPLPSGGSPTVVETLVEGSNARPWARTRNHHCFFMRKSLVIGNWSGCLTNNRIKSDEIIQDTCRVIHHDSLTL